MEKKIGIPQYDSNKGFKYKWEDGFEIETKIKDGAIELFANKEGLVSLANNLLNLAQEGIPVGYHLHFDEHNSLEGGSIDLIIQKK